MYDEYHKRNPFAVAASCPKCGFISNWDLQYKASRSDKKNILTTVDDKRLVGILDSAERAKYRDYVVGVYASSRWIDVTCPVCGKIFRSPIDKEFNDVLLVPNSHTNKWSQIKLWVDAEAIRADKNYRLKVYKPDNTTTTVTTDMVATNIVAKGEQPFMDIIQDHPEIIKPK